MNTGGAVNCSRDEDTWENKQKKMDLPKNYDRTCLMLLFTFYSMYDLSSANLKALFLIL